MPLYPFRCTNKDCLHEFDIYSSVAERDAPQTCDRCTAHAERFIAPSAILGADEWDYNHWNPGLGCWTKGTKHAEKIAKDRGMIPVGTEKSEDIHKHFDKQREKKRQADWDKL